ncbi:DUF742 domain-containing protein [Streptomyces sp. NPDC049881]|uniref:DUF742 domain-containing protein n=1 Tax=Streptomyces sp. NPDC049881 TaxID=3155778 RepID=UPI0034485F17
MSTDGDGEFTDIAELRNLLAETEDAIALAVDPIFDEEAGLRQLWQRTGPRPQALVPVSLPYPSDHRVLHQREETGRGDFRQGASSSPAGVSFDRRTLPNSMAEEHAGQPQPDPSSPVQARTSPSGGRRLEYRFAVETLVQSVASSAQLSSQLPEHQQICLLCKEVKSVAEISALLSMPLGLVRILVADLAEAGLIFVHANYHTGPSGRPDRALLERVLHGLRQLGSS